MRPLLGPRVQSLVRELRSHNLCNMAKKQTKKDKQKIHSNCQKIKDIKLDRYEESKSSAQPCSTGTQRVSVVTPTITTLIAFS